MPNNVTLENIRYVSDEEEIAAFTGDTINVKLADIPPLRLKHVEVGFEENATVALVTPARISLNNVANEARAVQTLQRGFIWGNQSIGALALSWDGDLPISADIREPEVRATVANTSSAAVRFLVRAAYEVIRIVA